MVSWPDFNPHLCELFVPNTIPNTIPGAANAGPSFTVKYFKAFAKNMVNLRPLIEPIQIELS